MSNDLDYEDVLPKCGEQRIQVDAEKRQLPNCPEIRDVGKRQILGVDPQDARTVNVLQPTEDRGLPASGAANEESFRVLAPFDDGEACELDERAVKEWIGFSRYTAEAEVTR